MREPTVMWWPGRIPAGKECHELAGTIDLLPTIAALSGAKLPGKKIDGKDITALIEGRPGAKTPHEAYFYRTKGVRSGNWKFIENKLYDLSKDISESKDVAAENPEVTTRLKNLLDAHKTEMSKEKRPCGRVGSEQPKKKKGKKK